ncbi:MAG TPA: glycosyl transferase family 2 [Ruminococcaceae bacterium]|nr:glycosyl transferase family 2 [Oscillospiraceae bacterium]
MHFFSIILPVYNVEKYLSQCVDSILNQNFDDYEIILVDDGSTDNCGEICDFYASNYENIKTVHRENGGLSVARNTGIEIAEGKFLIFIDSDDFYTDNNFLSDVYLAISKHPDADIVNYCWREYYDIDKEFSENKNSYDEFLLANNTTYEEVVKYSINNDMLYPSACSKALRRNFITDNRLLFKQGIVCEDIEWYMRVVPLCDKMIFINSFAYAYRKQRDGSITATISEKNLNDLLDTIELYFNKFVNSQNKVERLLLNYLAYQFVIVCGLLYRLDDKKKKKNCYLRLKKLQSILDYNLSNKVKKIHIIYKLFGLGITTLLLQLYIKYR